MAWLCCLGVERRGDLELPDGLRAFVVARFLLPDKGTNSNEVQRITGDNIHRM